MNWQHHCLVSCRTVTSLQKRQIAFTKLANCGKLIHSALRVCRWDELGRHQVVFEVVQLWITVFFVLEDMIQLYYVSVFEQDTFFFTGWWKIVQTADYTLSGGFLWRLTESTPSFCAEFHHQVSVSCCLLLWKAKAAVKKIVKVFM